jgi:8-oxo-(d)GTP phosphatase
VREAVVAAGAVLWREGARGEPEVAVVHRPRYDDWSLPKGKLDGDEPVPAAAVREVLEETGSTGPLGRPLGTTEYDVAVGGRLVPKTVHWFALEARDGAFSPGDEVDELLWLPVDQALRRLDPTRDGGVLERFAACPPRTATVLLVRHASAGDRRDWSGPDDLRPLDDKGRAQAARLAPVLRLWAPTRVVSAPPLRCVDTVAGLGADVEVVDVLGEAAFDLDRARALLAGLAGPAGAAGAPGAAVACSQGGAIPELVRTLTGREHPPAKKGSTWVLSFDGSDVVASAYLRV